MIYVPYSQRGSTKGRDDAVLDPKPQTLKPDVGIMSRFGFRGSFSVYEYDKIPGFRARIAGFRRLGSQGFDGPDVVGCYRSDYIRLWRLEIWANCLWK